METLKVTVSGVRGIVGDSLTPEVALSFARAFGTYIKGGKVVVARDTRPSGEQLKQSICLGLLETGCSIIDVGIAPTPTLLLMIKQLGANGGVVITASHNPAQWNGIKFASSEGTFLKGQQVEEFLNIWRQKKFNLVINDNSKYKARLATKSLKSIECKDAAQRHIEKVMNYIDAEIIRKRRFTVVLDSCNGAGSIITPMMLKELGCNVILINTETNGLFPHNPEPIAENLKELCIIVKAKKADIGFAQDADADRLAIVSEKGECIGEEYTLSLAVQFVLKKKAGIVVTNLSTTKAVDDIAQQYHSSVVRTKIGEINVVTAMKSSNAIIGGEGNGGVIVPEIVYGRDSLAGIGIVLQHLAETGLSISQLAATVPQYKMVKKKLEYPENKINMFLERIKEKYKDNSVNLEDGIKINFEDSWVHIRPSNTEPVIRVIAEAKTLEKAEELCEDVIRFMSYRP